MTENLTFNTSSRVEVEQNTVNQESENTLRLHLKKKEKKKKIQWTEDTIDNEGLGKKKSKCCCQYSKPRKDLDESSSDSESDCDNCFGHTSGDPKNKCDSDTVASGTQQ